VPYTTCVSMTGLHIWNVRWGASLMGNNSILSHDEIDHFGDDGIDYAANNIAITHNTIHDNFDIGDGNHEDAMQGQNGPLLRGLSYNAFSNILIDSNHVIRQTDPKLAFPTYLQGIDAFDEDWTNVTVTNNVVVTTACWGIFFSSSHNGKIINNTVVADNLMPTPGNCKPLVVVGDKTHQGQPSSDNIIRNNIANGLSIYNLDPNMTMDHNICLTIEGKCLIFTYVGGKPKWGVFKPGEYADHNIIERNGASGMFVSFDPAKFVYDLRLKSGTIAIGAGNSAEAPPVDITGARAGVRSILAPTSKGRTNRHRFSVLAASPR
jgi:parallel beta-helix repeat protein